MLLRFGKCLLKAENEIEGMDRTPCLLIAKILSSRTLILLNSMATDVVFTESLLKLKMYLQNYRELHFSLAVRTVFLIRDHIPTNATQNVFFQQGIDPELTSAQHQIFFCQIKNCSEINFRIAQEKLYAFLQGVLFQCWSSIASIFQKPEDISIYQFLSVVYQIAYLHSHFLEIYFCT